MKRGEEREVRRTKIPKGVANANSVLAAAIGSATSLAKEFHWTEPSRLSAPSPPSPNARTLSHPRVAVAAAAGAISLDPRHRVLLFFIRATGHFSHFIQAVACSSPSHPPQSAVASSEGLLRRVD